MYTSKNGIIIKEVYNNFSSLGDREIEFDDGYWDVVEDINNNQKVFNILQLVYDKYAGFTA